jgi:hypothetical protein
MGQAEPTDFEILSGLSRADLTDRLKGPEMLLEEMLRRTPDEQLPSMMYLIRDWLVANRDMGFTQLGKYFNQDKQKIDEACTMFKDRRKKYCHPEGLAEGQYPVFELFLLMDCMVYVGAGEAPDRLMGFLTDDSIKPSTKYTPNQLFQDPERHGKIYNFVLQDGQLIINRKTYYHSELATGKPVASSGEIAVIKQDDTLRIHVSSRSGHYRPSHESLELVKDIIVRDLKDNGCTVIPEILFSTDYLSKDLARITELNKTAEESKASTFANRVGGRRTV